MADEQTTEQRGLTAPYTAFSSVKTAIRLMDEHGLPSRIDRSVLTNFSGAVVTQVITAFKFLGLMDGEGRPTNQLQKLIDSVLDENDWPVQLAKVLRAAYAPLFLIDLEKASPGEFNEVFKRTYPGAEDVMRKSVTFFLNAAREAKIPISQYIMKNKKPRSGPAKRRISRKQSTGTTGSVVKALDDAIVRAAAAPAKPLEYQLLDLVSQDMSKDERDAVWTLINYLKNQQP